jgi:protease-4
MKGLFSLCGLMLLPLACAIGQVTFPSYYSTSDLALAPPGALKYGLYGYDNPALLTTLRQPDFQFSWTDAGRWNDFNRWGMFLAAPNVGFGAVKTKTDVGSLTDYRLSLGFGDRSAAFGIAYSFAGGDKAAFGRRNAFTAGTLTRVDPHLSLGLVGTTTITGGSSEAVVDFGLRPFANERVTLFADYGIQSGEVMKDANWSYGAAVEALPGIRLTGRYFDSHSFSVGISLSLGNAGFSGQSTWDKDSRHSFNSYAIRLGAYDRTILEKLAKHSEYVSVNMNGNMKYQRFVLFDNSQTLLGTLTAIAAAKNDESVAGIAINTSGMSINGEMLWEVREALRDFKSAGKKVVVFIDRPSMEEYCFATVADKIVLDPTGILLLPGFAASRTFFKGTLEKLGIGFDEWRFFKYKSANEYLSREKFSDADREQRQKYINDVYAVVKSEVCASRGMTAEQFDGLINNDVLILPQEAVEKNLVDTLGRWDAVMAMVNRLEGHSPTIVGPGSIADFNLPYDNHWGEPPRIAVIYALGVCAMDEGIKARTLVNEVQAAGADPLIKAIVLRVDSPGGDGTASDYIAEAVKKAKVNKPVIVSQGYVAASGGYWLSMNADTIVASPVTITGSIGVIGGWFYNAGLKEKLGISTDAVKAGEHADFMTGMTLPLVGVSIPDRNLTDAERAKMEHAIRSFYSDFVGKVAAGRHSKFETIEPIAQGHFYSGVDGKALGLVDVLGGLQTALDIAKRRAGIPADENVTVIELPSPPLIDLSFLVPKFFGLETPVLQDPVIQQLKFRLDHNGQPLPMMDLEDIPSDMPRE